MMSTARSEISEYKARRIGGIEATYEWHNLGNDEMGGLVK